MLILVLKLICLKSSIAVRAESVAEHIQITVAVGVSGGVRRLHLTAVERINHLTGDLTSGNVRKNSSNNTTFNGK